MKQQCPSFPAIVNLTSLSFNSVEILMEQIENIERSKYDNTEDGYINWSKFEDLTQIVKTVKYFQKRTYSVPRDARLQTFTWPIRMNLCRYGTACLGFATQVRVRAIHITIWNQVRRLEV